MRLLTGFLLVLASSLPIAAEDANDYPATIGSEPPMIGMFPGGVPDDLARKQGLPSGTGVLVLGVMPGSMADRMGLKTGDVVTSFNGAPVNSYEEIVAARDQNRAGDQAEMAFVRDGQRQSATGTLGAWPHDDASAGMRRANDLLHRAAETAQGQRDADQRRDVDGLGDQLAKLRERLDRADADRDRRGPEAPWRLEWRSHPAQPEENELATSEPPVDASAPADGESAWRLRWSNAAVAKGR